MSQPTDRFRDASWSFPALMTFPFRLSPSIGLSSSIG